MKITIDTKTLESKSSYVAYPGYDMGTEVGSDLSRTTEEDVKEIDKILHPEKYKKKPVVKDSKDADKEDKEDKLATDKEDVDKAVSDLLGDEDTPSKEKAAPDDDLEDDEDDEELIGEDLEDEEGDEEDTEEGDEDEEDTEEDDEEDL